MGFPGGSVLKKPPANAGDAGDQVGFLGQNDSSGERNGNPLQCSCLGNSMDTGVSWATDQGFKKGSDVIEHRLSQKKISPRKKALPLM